MDAEAKTDAALRALASEIDSSTTSLVQHRMLRLAQLAVKDAVLAERAARREIPGVTGVTVESDADGICPFPVAQCPMPRQCISAAHRATVDSP